MLVFYGLLEVDIYFVKLIVLGCLVKWVEKKSIVFIFWFFGFFWEF